MDEYMSSLRRAYKREMRGRREGERKSRRKRRGRGREGERREEGREEGEGRRKGEGDLIVLIVRMNSYSSITKHGPHTSGCHNNFII